MEHVSEISTSWSGYQLVCGCGYFTKSPVSTRAKAIKDRERHDRKVEEKSYWWVVTPSSVSVPFETKRAALHSLGASSGKHIGPSSYFVTDDVVVTTDPNYFLAHCTEESHA
jgi:hypothetical protein